MTTGGGIEHGDDFVAARLSIDVPTEGLASLRELTSEIERFRVNVESANRTGDNFTAYLKASAEAAEHATGAYQNLVAQLQRVSEVQQRISTGAPVAGGGGLDPFAGVQHGRGGAIPTTVVPDASAQIAELNARDPRTYLNMQAARGNLQSGDVGGGSSAEIRQAADQVAARDQAATIQHQQNPPALPTPRGGPDLAGLGGRIGQASGLAQQVMGEMQAGGSMQGMLAAGANIASSAAAAGGVNGAAALSGLSRFAGPVGLGLTAAMAGYGLAQKGGEIVQGYANMGSVRGGGAMEGMGYEASIRAMAMNPFLTTEQSRQIIMGALTEGYSGQTFDSVTKFMASNLTDMNLSVSKSVELLRTNVNEGGQSIAGLASNLAVLKQASQTGAMSLPDTVANFESTSGALVKAGVGGPQAAQAATVAGQMWNDSQVLKGKGGDLLAQMASSPGGQATAFALSGTPMPAGALPGTLFARTGDGGLSATNGMLKRFAQIAHNANPRDALNGAKMFQMLIGQTGMQLDFPQAQEMYLDLLSGKNPLEEGKQEAQQALKDATRPQWRSPLEIMGGTLYDVGKQLTDIPRSEFNLATSILGGKGWDDVKRRFGDVKTALSGQDMVTGKGNARHIPMMDRIVDAYGPGGIEILDEKNRAIAFDQTNGAQLQGLSEGKYTWRPKGAQGQGTKLSDTPMEGNIKELMAQGKQPVSVQGSVTLDLTPEARRALTPQGGTNVQLTPHERQANMGYGDARPNNAPPGEGTITRGRSGW